MAGIEVKQITDLEEWEAFIASRPEANFLHSWYWGDFHERMGHAPIRVGFYRKGELIGVLLAVFIAARRGRHLVVPGGPILDWQDAKLVAAWREELQRLAREKKCVFVRCRPQLLDTPASRQEFKKLGFRRAPLHLHAELTWQLDITKPNDELLRAMRKGTRYELNRAKKLDIEVTSSTDPELLEEFYTLQLETARRQKFVPFSKSFLTKQFEAFAAADKVLMYRSTFEGKLLAMAFVIFYGNEAAYHYGASTDLARKMPGAYAVQWQAIQDARLRGCSRYNFWGVAPHGETKHRFYGVSVFKRGFGGEDVAYLPAHDLVIKPLRYAALLALEKSQHARRHL